MRHRIDLGRHLVDVAQSGERLVVVQEVAGSKPAAHPKDNSTESSAPGVNGNSVTSWDADTEPPILISGAHHSLCLVCRQRLLQLGTKGHGFKSHPVSD